MMRLHVDGTRRVLEAMAAAKVGRMVLASTSGTVAVSKDPQVFDESFDYATDVVAGWPYYASKIYQEKLAFRLGAELGIDVVAVNPSLLLGPGDRRLSSTGDVRRFLRRQIPTVPKGGINFVDARDAAAADRGRARAGHARPALPARRPQLDRRRVLRPPRPGRQGPRAAPPAAEQAQPLGRRRPRGALPPPRRRAAGRPHLGRDERALLVVRLGPGRARPRLRGPRSPADPARHRRLPPPGRRRRPLTGAGAALPECAGFARARRIVGGGARRPSTKLGPWLRRARSSRGSSRSSACSVRAAWGSSSAPTTWSSASGSRSSSSCPRPCSTRRRSSASCARRGPRSA